jgi:TPR repeat protein
METPVLRKPGEPGPSVAEFSVLIPALKSAADGGDAFAQLRYGLCLQRALGVPQDLTEAARYLKLSAD